MKRVYKGSVAMAWLEEHGDETCMQRFCSDDMASESWWCTGYQKVLAPRKTIDVQWSQNLQNPILDS